RGDGRRERKDDADAISIVRDADGSNGQRRRSVGCCLRSADHDTSPCRKSTSVAFGKSVEVFGKSDIQVGHAGAGAAAAAAFARCPLARLFYGSGRSAILAQDVQVWTFARSTRLTKPNRYEIQSATMSSGRNISAPAAQPTAPLASSTPTLAASSRPSTSTAPLPSSTSNTAASSAPRPPSTNAASAQRSASAFSASSNPTQPRVTPTAEDGRGLSDGYDSEDTFATQNDE
ncbi:hypothetical protein THAOC_00797, partial [Thalassiosira oceanica]